VEAVSAVRERDGLAAADGEVAGGRVVGELANLPLMREASLNGLQAATVGAAIGGDCAFGVAIPPIVPAFAIVVPALTLPVTVPFLSIVTPPRAERTSPATLAEPTATRPLLNSLASLPWLAEPYGPTLESKLSTSVPVPLSDTESRPITPGRESR
jgi:hypothetical protein